MDLENIIPFLKENFPKNTIEIKSCLELLSEAIDSASSAILRAYETHHNAKNFSKIKEFADFAEKKGRLR